MASPIASPPPALARLLQRQLRALAALLDQHQQHQPIQRLTPPCAIEDAAGGWRGVSTASAAAAAAAAAPSAAVRTTRRRGPPLAPKTTTTIAPSSPLLPEGDLFARIRAARSLSELELVVARHALSFRPPHVAAALASLPPLALPAATATTTLNRRARAHRLVCLLALRGLVAGGAAARVSGTDAVACLRAMARLRCAPDEAVRALAERLVSSSSSQQPLVTSLQPSELASVAWALATIERRVGGGWWSEGEGVAAAARAAAVAATSSSSGGSQLSSPSAVLPPALLPTTTTPSEQDGDYDNEAEDALTTALLASLPAPEPPPVPPRGRGAAPLPPPLPLAGAAAGASSSSSNTTTALAPAQSALPALWRHIEDRSRARVHSFAPAHAAALAWAFAATGRCRNGSGRAAGALMSAADYHAAVSLRAQQQEGEEKEEQEEEERVVESAAAANAAPSASGPTINLLTALSRSLLVRLHTLTDPTDVARLLEAIALASSSSSSSSAGQKLPPPSLLPQAQRELADALGDRAALLKASFRPPGQLVACLASLAAAGVPHARAAEAVGRMVADRLRPAIAAETAAAAGPPPPPLAAAPAAASPSSDATCLRGGWLPQDVPSYLRAARVMAHSDPAALMACARALPACAPHLPARDLAEALEALVDLGLGRRRGGGEEEEEESGREGATADEASGAASSAAAKERAALSAAAAGVSAAVDAEEAGLPPGAAARLLWAYAMVPGAGGGDGHRRLEAPLRALRAAEEEADGAGEGRHHRSRALLSPHELHRLYQAHRLLTDEWVEEEGGSVEGRWPPALVRAAVAAARRRGGKKSKGGDNARVDHACDLLSEAGLEPVARAGADGGAIQMDVALVMEEEGGAPADAEPTTTTTTTTPRLVALMLDPLRSRRRASNAPHALLGAAEADMLILTERLGWSSVVRVPWFEWEAAAGGASEEAASVRLRGGGSAAAALRRRARRGSDPDNPDDDHDRRDASLLAWILNKLV